MSEQGKIVPSAHRMNNIRYITSFGIHPLTSIACRRRYVLDSPGISFSLANIAGISVLLLCLLVFLSGSTVSSAQENNAVAGEDDIYSPYLESYGMSFTHDE